MLILYLSMPRIDRPDLGKIDTGTQLSADDMVGNLWQPTLRLETLTGL